MSNVVQENFNVVVIGAGLAGLTTAYRLKQKGINAQIYEAKPRVGGRVFSVNILGAIAELGAQNITDGGKCQNIYKLIDEMQLELIRERVSLSYSYFDGQHLIPSQNLSQNKSLNPQALRNQIDKLIKTSNNLQEMLDQIVDTNDSLHKAISVRLAAYEGAGPEKLSTFYAETLFHMLLGGICSAHQACSNQEQFVDIACIKEGNARLTEKMAYELEGNIHLNTPLIKVSKNIDHSFLLTFQNHQTVKANILILTMPCSVYNDIIFDENIIAKETLEAIRKVQYGMNSKIMVPLPHLHLKMTGLVGDQIISFKNVMNNLLTIYYTQETSLFTSSTVSDAYHYSRPMIEALLQAHCPLFTAPVIAKDNIDSYDTPVGYSWPNDQYAKGSYSYIASGQEILLTKIHEENGEKVRTLFAPIDYKLYFAGEHTSILLDVPGTMEAACESGERIARMILKKSYSS